MDNTKFTKEDGRFREFMGGFFHDFLRASGITMTPGNTNERLREIGERMASTIEHAAERKAVELIKRLQDAVSGAFVKMETQLDKQEILIRDLNNRLQRLETVAKAQEWEG
jgi:hypothetical protein